MSKAHATDPGVDPLWLVPADRTLCNRPAMSSAIDNAMPDCKRCLRIIAKRTRA